ncbi:hypothetical protein NL676_024047 [Syzygium grande]|nr:hypothetical protein NL676_024047 [Syzygium grande]
MGIDRKGYEIADTEDAEKSIRKRMKKKRRGCLWLCCSNVETGLVVREDGQDEKAADNSLPAVSALSHVDGKEKGVLVLGNRSCLLMCCSNLEGNTKGEPSDKV